MFILAMVLVSKVYMRMGLRTSNDTGNVEDPFQNKFASERDSPRFLQSSILSCPYPDDPPIFISDGEVNIQKASPGILCTLTTAVLNDNSVVTSLVPLARSYDGFDWERAAGGGVSVTLYRNQSWNCDFSSCQITLPPLQDGMTYRLASYNRALPERDEIARFLESTTFGPTQVELDQFYNITDNGTRTDNLQTRMAHWVWRQMDVSQVGMTSHREFWRKRANMRVSIYIIHYMSSD